MNRKRLFLLLSSVLLLLGTTLSRTALAADATTVTIAFIGASTGSQAAEDKLLYDAAQLAASQINDDGLYDSSSNKYVLEIKYYEANTTNKLKEKFTTAKADKVAAILVPADSDRLNTILSKDNGSFAVLSASSDTTDKTNVFRLGSSSTSWAKDAADYLVNERHFARIAVVGVNTETAQTGIKNFKTAAGDKNIVTTLTHKADATSLRETARSIRDARADAIFAWTLDAQMSNLLDSLKDVGWTGTIVYQALSDGFVQTAGAQKTNGLLGTQSWMTGAYQAKSQIFVSDYAKAFGTQPSDKAAAYYDAVKMITEVIRKGSKDAASISSGLTSQSNFTGVQGRYDAGKLNNVLLVQARADGKLIEAARYANDSCTTCLNTGYADTTATKATKTSTLNIALIGTLSGISSTLGDATTHGAQLAIREINDKGGIIGPNSARYTLVLTTYNATTAKEADDAIKKAKDAGASIILGPDYNGQILSNLGEPYSQGVPQIVSATSSDITQNETNDYVFSARANDSELGKAAAKYLTDKRELTQFATFAVRTDYGLNTINAIKDTIAASDNGHVITSVDHNVDQTDYAAYAKQLADSGAEAIFVWTTQPAARGLIEALGKTEWKGVLVYGYLTPDFVKDLKVPANIELIGPVNWWNNNSDWASADFTTRFTSYYGTAPAPQSAAYYDAIHLIAHGVKEVGSKASDLQSWLKKQTTFRGVQGQYQPNTYGNGELSRSVTLIQVGAKGINELARYENSNCWVNCLK